MALPIRLLAFDPGLVNFGFNLIDLKSEEDWDIAEMGMVKPTVTGYEKQQDGILGKLPANGMIFKDRIEELMQDVDVVVIERFQNMKKLKLQITEFTNFMLGMVHAVCLEYGLPVKYLQVADWKNSVNTLIDLNGMKAKIVSGIKKNDDILAALDDKRPNRTLLADTMPHMVDSLTMGLWAAAPELELDRLALVDESAILHRTFNYLEEVGFRPPGVFE